MIIRKGLQFQKVVISQNFLKTSQELLKNFLQTSYNILTIIVVIESDQNERFALNIPFSV